MFTIPLTQKSRIQSVCKHARVKINPIFNQLLVNASTETGLVTFRASNGTQSISFEIEGNIKSNANFTLDAKRLHTVLDALSGDSVQFKLNDDHVLARSGKSRLKLELGAVSAYPDAPELNNCLTKVTCSIGDLSGLFNYASYAAGNNDVRFYLNYLSLHIESATQKLTVCATDGHRLSQLSCNSLSCEGGGHFLTPLSLFNAILSQGLSNQTEVIMEISESMIRLQSTDITIVSTLGDGSYPDVNRVIPAIGHDYIQVDLKSFRSLVQRLHSVAALEKLSALRLEIDTSLTISVACSGNNEFSEDMDAEIHCAPLTLGLNASYLADALARQSGEFVRIYPNGNNAVLLCCEIEELTTLIMPTRV
ncbi:hypothetical protein I6M49_21880 [Shewanella algae]|uniref:DNA polymerase III subunit beta n=1 Tax=Shewanella algae TaxID=38313 RepID=UPI001AACED62|nr:DNA polymerase III subunit beta [Shewanella algae]MBO2656095.1 hypothetical protein [Shewanella algae]